ncbi:uncharacterized protein LOC120346438 isoform X1 [Styela clava]
MGVNTWRILIVLIITYEVDLTVGKSCHYNNLHALYGWTLVKSPGYPRKFPSQTQCWWKISAPPQYKIQLELTDFALVEPNSQNRCIWQWLNVVDGTIKEGEDETGPGQPPMLTLCGTNRPRIVISSGNTLRLNLHSNAAAASSSYRGFSARYKYTTDAAFMPSSMSNLLPSSAASPGKPPAAPASSSGIRSIGDVIAPFAKSRPLPPNPNAVLTLKNRRTEAKNRARNEAENSHNNNGPVYYSGGRNPSQYEKPTTRIIPTLANNIIQQDELPSRRSKPLPHEIKILLAVLGTVGAIALVLYLLKRIFYDKAHKKSSGKIMHAYAHFRHFKKKRKNKKDEEEGDRKVNTISASIAESTSGTLRTRDSEVASSNENYGKDQHNVMHPRRTHPQQSEITENSNNDKSRKDVEAVQVAVPTTNDKHRKNEHERKSGSRQQRHERDNREREESNSSSNHGYHEQHERRRRRTRRREVPNDTVPTENNSKPKQSRSGQGRREQGKESITIEKNDRGQQRRAQTGTRGSRNPHPEKRNRKHHTKSFSDKSQNRRNISDYSSDDKPNSSNKKSWRDRAYS